MNKKLLAALKFGLRPVLCVGETLPEREAGRTLEKVKSQLDKGLEGVARPATGTRSPWPTNRSGPSAPAATPRPAQAQEVHRHIAGNCCGKRRRAAPIRILYGGSVKPENSLELLSQADISGVLVGRRLLESGVVFCYNPQRVETSERIGGNLEGILLFFHIVVCLLLVIVVLLQSGKSADLAGAFGGYGSQSTFGPRGTASLLSKITTTLAVLFMVTSLLLQIVAAGKNRSGLGAGQGKAGGQEPDVAAAQAREHRPQKPAPANPPSRRAAFEHSDRAIQGIRICHMQAEVV